MLTISRSTLVPSFNPRSPCGERQRVLGLHPVDAIVSTHAPLAGSDRGVPIQHGRLPVSTHAPLAGSDGQRAPPAHPSISFQPTLPLRGATALDRRIVVAREVSTHAPLAGSDRPFAARPGRAPCFNPRSPCGERPGAPPRIRRRTPFQPTLPLRGATRSITPVVPMPSSFNPRSPCGERLLHLVNVALRAYHMHDVFHPNASSDELRPSETNQKAVRTSQGIPDSPQFAPPIIPTAYS